MADNRAITGLTRKVISATVSRNRFAGSMSLFAAFAGGVAIFRLVAYSLLLIIQFCSAAKTTFFVYIVASMLALWTTIIVLSTHEASVRTSVDWFLYGTELGPRLRRRLRRELIVRRPVTIAIFTSLLCLNIVATANAIGLDPSLLLWTLLSLILCGSMLAASAIIARRPETRTVNLSEGTTVVMLLLALAGPDFRIDDGVVVPLIFNTIRLSGRATPGLLLPLIMPTLLLAQLAYSAIFGRATRAAGGIAIGFPMLRLFFRRFRFVYWISIMLVSMILFVTLGRSILIPISLAAIGTVFWLATATNYVITARRLWSLRGPLAAMRSQIRIVALVSFVIHLAISFFIRWVV